MRVGDRGEMALTANRYGVSFIREENVLKLDCRALVSHPLLFLYKPQ